ncbi:MAG: hypothetical protein ACI9XO_003175 [Paraglaciecola sp.]|jgi:hypothetical protein
MVSRLKKIYQKADLEIKVVEQVQSEQLNEATFWSVIALLDWSNEKEHNILAQAKDKLASFSVPDIQKFQDILAEKLFALDQQVFAENIGSRRYNGDKYFSANSFLYARACVVANSQNFMQVY